MSTNAIFEKLQADGTVRSVYLHHDGYFSYAGRILRTFYRTEKRIDARLALGNLSGPGPTPYGKDASTPQVLDKVHCRAYIRDFGHKEKEEILILKRMTNLYSAKVRFCKFSAIFYWHFVLNT